MLANAVQVPLLYFDADLVADFQARQTCCEMCINEGDLILFTLPGHRAPGLTSGLKIPCLIKLP